MSALSAIERDTLAKAIFSRLCKREHYDKASGGRSGDSGQWVTIGGGPGPKGQQHAGGTPVKIGAGGQIEAGPDNLEGKHIDHVDRNKTEPKGDDPRPPTIPPAPSYRAPGAPASGGPPVDERKHADVKAAVGDDKTLVAYQHEGAYYFLHGDAEHAQKVLDATAVTNGGIDDAVQKLVGAGHRVAIAEPEGADSPNRKPNRRKGGDRGQPAKSAEKPATPPPSGATGKPPGPPKPPQKAPAAAGGDDPGDEFKLRGGRDVKPLPKPRQTALFDKLQQPDSPEAKEMPTAAAIARGSGPHRLKNEHGETPPAGVTAGEGGIWTGTATLHADDIQMDPGRFQYKVSGIGKSGVTKQLADVKRFNPMFGGQILVWRDPGDGKTYVINGHHRVELAKRSGPYSDETTGMNWNGEMQSFYIPAKTAEQARAWGALANMAAGHGTATDAAKYLRDSGNSIEDLQSHGVSIKGKLAADAVQLKDLSNRAFDDLVAGTLPEGRAVAVATHVKDPAMQARLFQRLAERERQGRPVSDQAAGEAAKAASLAGGTQEKGGGLFSDDDAEHSLEIEYGEVVEAAKKSLAAERNTFRAVTSSKRSGRLAAAGNVLETEGNRERARKADETLQQFATLAHSKGEVANAIRSAAERLYHEPTKRDEILGEFLGQLPETLDRSWQQFKSGQSEPAERYSAAATIEQGGIRGSGSGSRRAAAEGNPRTGHTGTGPVRSGEVRIFRQQVEQNLEIAALRRAIAPSVERYAARWDESKHPRGQPENAGEFAKVPHAQGATGQASPSSADYRPQKSPQADPARPVDARGLRASLEAGDDPQRAVANNAPPHQHPAVAEVEKQYPPANPAGIDTLSRHRNHDGTFTPERQALHARISEKFRGSVPPSTDKVFRMMGGGPASGKSSLLKAGLVSADQVVHVDSDEIKHQLPEYAALVGEKHTGAAQYAHEESSTIAKQITADSLAVGQNVLLDGVGDGSYENVAAKIQQARAAGYRVAGDYVTCSIDEALRRNRERAKKTGRLPPEDMLVKTHTDVSRLLPRLASEGLFDELNLWDTEHQDANGRPVLVMSAGGGQVKIHQPALWELFQSKVKQQKGEHYAAAA